MSYNKNCNCCKCTLIAESIASKNGITTITVPKDSITNLCECEKVYINLRTAIPTESECNRIKITDGTTTLDVACNNQYYRPCKLYCRSILTLEFRSDPELLIYLNTKR